MIYELDASRRDDDPSRNADAGYVASHRARISDADRLLIWRERVAERYGLVPNWSDADNLSKHMYAGAGPRVATV